MVPSRTEKEATGGNKTARHRFAGGCLKTGPALPKIRHIRLHPRSNGQEKRGFSAGIDSADYAIGRAKKFHNRSSSTVAGLCSFDSSEE